MLILPGFGGLVYLGIEHILYWLGLTEGQQLLNRPLLSLSLSVLIMGIIIFLTGFVCDFILHHQIRRNIRQIVDLNVASVTEMDQAELRKAQRAVASGKDK